MYIFHEKCTKLPIFGQETGLKIADFLLLKAGEKALSHKKIEKNNDGRDVFLADSQ